MHLNSMDMPAKRRRTGDGLAVRIANSLRRRARTVGGSALLGREGELSAQYGVSRSTMRGAIRELERQGIARMVQGRRGGLYVLGSPISAPARRLTDYLLLTDASMGEVAETTMWLYRYAAHVAAERRLGGAALARATTIVAMPERPDGDLDRWCAMRSALVAAAGNRVLSFFHEALFTAFRDTLASELNMGPPDASQSLTLWAHEQAAIRAVTAGDVAATDAATLACTGLETDYMRHSLDAGMLSSSLRPKRLYRPHVPGVKLAHQTVRALHHEIRESGAPPGSRIGSIKELADRYGVSIEIMRDALLLGQRLGLVAARRGRGGGVFASARDEANVVADAAAHLRRAADPGEVRAVLGGMEWSRRSGSIADMMRAILTQAVADDPGR